MRRVVLTKDEQRKILAQRAQNVPFRRIAAEMGYSTGVIMRFVWSVTKDAVEAMPRCGRRARQPAPKHEPRPRGRPRLHEPEPAKPEIDAGNILAGSASGRTFPLQRCSR